MATLVLTIVTPDSVQAVKDQLDTTPQTGAITPDSNSIRNVARYIDGIANGALNNTSVTITSIS